MGKLIAIWGSPNSGKTVFAVKLASAIYNQYKSTVIVLHCDMETPALPVLFPNLKADELTSVGVALSKTEITQDNVIKSIVTLKNKQDFGFLGFKDGENKYTYPGFDDIKASALLSVLQSLSDYVIVDCTSSLENVLSDVSIKQADEVIRLAAPDLKSLSFYSSQLTLYADPKYRLDVQIQGININESDCYMPVEEAKIHFKEVAFTLPYCRGIRQQMQDGSLSDQISDKKFNKKIEIIAHKVV